MPHGSYADRFTRWERLYQNLTVHAQELPEIADDLKRLQDLVQRASAMRSRQDASKAQFQDDVTARRALDQEGEELRTRISFTLKGKYGIHGDKLYAFGLRPVKARRSKKAATTNPPPDTPTSTVPAPTAPAPAAVAGGPAGPQQAGPAAEPSAGQVAK